jgi:hypothetical protein
VGCITVRPAYTNRYCQDVKGAGCSDPPGPVAPLVLPEDLPQHADGVNCGGDQISGWRAQAPRQSLS